MGFGIEGLVARYYEDYVSKRILDRMGMTLRSLKTYRYIDNKTKSYQNIKRIFPAIYLFPLGLVIKPSH